MTPRFYIPEPVEGVPLHNLFFFKFAPERLTANVFNEPPFPNYFETAVFVDSLDQADAILLPNNFNAVPPTSADYIAKYADEGEKRKIPVYVFAFGDYSYRVEFDPRVRVFLMSSYRSELRTQDVIVPTTARSFEDIPRAAREKSDMPTISFCGFAGFKTRKQWLSYFVKNLGWDLAAIARPILKARKLGIYWRRRAMDALTRSGLVHTNFIVRRSFSGAARTIELSPAEARTQFIDSIVDADFVLTPKGDGNYSNRFLETLSLGRIPVLIDTDAPLPCEDAIPYKDIIVRVPMNEVGKIATYIRNFYDPLSSEEWKRRQALAHELFETHLRQDVFFRNYFERLFR